MTNKIPIFMFLVFNCCVHMMKYLCFFEIIDAFVIGFAFVKDSALSSFLTSKIPPHYSFLKWAKSSCGRFCAAPPRKSCQSSTSVRSPSPLGRNMNNYARFSIWLVVFVCMGGMVSKLEGEKRLFPATQPLSARSNLSHRLTDIRPLEKEILKACL